MAQDVFKTLYLSRDFHSENAYEASSTSCGGGACINLGLRAFRILMFAATACGNVQPSKPPADAGPQGGRVCKFEVDKFDSGCVFAP